jgi:rod shape determining protein RodA
MLLCIQFVMNVGMNVGLMPVIGVPLPFLSAGGSSLISAMAAIGVVESIAIRQRFLRSPLTREM